MTGSLRCRFAIISASLIAHGMNDHSNNCNVASLDNTLTIRVNLKPAAQQAQQPCYSSVAVPLNCLLSHIRLGGRELCTTIRRSVALQFS